VFSIAVRGFAPTEELFWCEN